MKSYKTMVKITILVSLIIVTTFGGASRKAFAQDTTLLLFDDFDGDTLDPSIWMFNPNSVGASYRVNNGELQITSGFTHGGGGIIRSITSYYAYPDTLVLEIRAKTSNRDGGNVAFIDDNLVGRIAFMNSGCGWPVVTGLQAGTYTIYNQSLCVDIPDIQTENYHIYRIEYNGIDSRFFVDDVLVLSQFDVLVPMPMHIQMDRVSAGIEETYTVDYVKLYSLSSSPYSFTGFFQPVDNLPILNTVNAGRAIPIKFSLSSDHGLDIFVPGYPVSILVPCGSTAEGATEATITTGKSKLSYDASTDQYTYIWDTDKSWAGTCRTFIFKLEDGTFHRANFKFK